jgi:hypothetical protein
VGAGVEASGASHASADDWLLPPAFHPSCCSSLRFHILSFCDGGARVALGECLPCRVTSCFSGRPSAKSGTPGYSPKTQNEPEKCFIINESTQKRTRERTRTNPGGQGPRSRKSFKVRKAFFGKLKTNPKRTRAAIQAGLVRFN